MPVIGFLNGASYELSMYPVEAFAKALAKPVISKAATFPSSIARRTANTIAFRRWQPIWFGDRLA
jgi:hypothetical protein